MVERIRPPSWFWLIALLAILWGVMGVVAFYMDLTMSPAAIADLSS